MTQTSISPAEQRSSALSLLESMLRQYTPSGEERPLSQWLADYVRPFGLRASVDAVGNLIAELPATTSDAGAPIVLLGHIDTVPGMIPVRFDGDRLYGRGSVDAKGPFAAFISATIALTERAPRRQRPIVLVGAVEEEAATSRGARAVLDRFQPDCVVIGEPSGSDGITLGYKGRLIVNGYVERAIMHTARAEESACAHAVAIWHELNTTIEQWNSENVPVGTPRAHFATIMPSLRNIHSSSDGFIQRCEFQIGIRLPIGFDMAGWQTRIRTIAEAHYGTVAFFGGEEAYLASRYGRLPASFAQAIRREGMAPTYKLKTGTSDMNIVGPVWNCPILAYGPGDANLDHTPNEHINLREFAQGITILTSVLTDLVNAGGIRS
jgi:N-acetyl-ornithine/N-acetyl-lysine deacetylase